MADKAVSVLARLKNIAVESGRSNQLCLQLFCQEEFLRRLSASKYADNFVLKGGLFLYSITNFDSRVTVDVDFLLQRIPNTPEQLRTVIKDILSVPTENDYITFEITDVSPISVAKKYSGISVSLVAHIKNTRMPFSIDFGVGDVIVPHQEKRKIPTQLPDFESPIINTYSIETTVAEKIDAILNLMEYSSRMKDYYDIYYIANHFDFDGQVLVEALKKTFLNREHTFTNEQFKKMLTFADDKAMKQKWTAFIKKIDIQTDDFYHIIDTMKMFLSEPFTAYINNTNFHEIWNSTKLRWEAEKDER